MGEAAAHGATVADLHVADVPSCLMQQWPARGYCGGPFEGALARHGANAQLVIFDPEIIQFTQAIEIHQVRGPGQAEIHQWHQALPTGERPGRVFVQSEQ